MSESTQNPEVLPTTPTLAQKITQKIEAHHTFNQNHFEWSDRKKRSELNHTPFSDPEPQPSPDALSGEKLLKIQTDSSTDTDQRLDRQDLPVRVNNLKEIITEGNSLEDKEEKTVFFAGVLQGMEKYHFPTFEDELRLYGEIIDSAPESFALYQFNPLNLSEISKFQTPSSYRRDQERTILKDAQILLNPDLKKLLTHLVSETSSVEPEQKAQYSFLLDKSRVATLLASQRERTISQTNFSAESLVSTLGLDSGEITKAFNQLSQKDPQTFSSPSEVPFLGLPALLGKIYENNPQETTKHYALICTRELLERGQRDNDIRGDRKTVLDATVPSTISLMGIGDIPNLYYKHVRELGDSIALNEFGNLFQEHQDFSDSIRTNIDSAIRAKQEAATKQAAEMARQKAIQEKEAQRKHSQEIVDQFKSHQDIQKIITNWAGNINSRLESQLPQVRKLLDQIKTTDAASSEIVDFAHQVINETNRLRQEGQIVVEYTREIGRQKKHLFSNKDLVRYQTTYGQDNSKFTSFKDKINREIKDNPSLDNFATHTALNYLNLNTNKTINFTKEENRKP